MSAALLPRRHTARDGNAYDPLGNSRRRLCHLRIHGGIAEAPCPIPVIGSAVRVLFFLGFLHAFFLIDAPTLFAGMFTGETAVVLREARRLAHLRVVRFSVEHPNPPRRDEMDVPARKMLAFQMGEPQGTVDPKFSGVSASAVTL